MIVILKQNTSENEINNLTNSLEAKGVEVSKVKERILLY